MQIYGNWKTMRLSHRMAAALLIAATMFAQSAYSASKTILVLGDSLSAEYGIARGTGWVALLEQKLKAEKINAAVVNASISGETTSGGAARLPSLLKKHRPQVVVIELGGNDGLRGLPLAATETNLKSMIAASKNAGAKPLLVGMRLPPNYGAAYADQFFALYGKVAQETRSNLVPFLLEGIATDAAMFQPDRIHPTAEAHPTMLRNVWPQLKPLIGK